MSVVSLRCHQNQFNFSSTPPLSSMKFDSMFFAPTDWWIHHWAAARQTWDVHLMRPGRSFRPSQPQTVPQSPHRDAPRVTRTRNETCRAQAWPQLSLRMGQTVGFYSHSCLQLKVSEATGSDATNQSKVIDRKPITGTNSVLLGTSSLRVYNILMLPQKLMRNVVLCHKSIY